MQTNLAWETLFDVAAQPPGPLHERLTRAIRAAIRNGRLPRGAALPPSRTLAADLNISRWAVTQAYGQLVTEGYLASRTGSATRVMWSPEPDDDRIAHRSIPSATTPPPPPRFDLSMCSPDYRAFPRRKWVEAIRTAAENTPFDQLDYGDTGGEPRLRAILAEHLNRSRGAAAEAATVSVFTGARQAMAQICRALFEADHRQIGMENPGSSGLWEGARTAGLDLVALPVDEDGLVVDALDQHPELRAVCVGAAHQLMLGCPLAPQRRLALLDWARSVDGLVIEDDYDAEFSHDGPAPPVMQGSDRRRVALIGSMSRALTPTINVGWVIAPPYLVAKVGAGYTPTPPALTQLALANFMESGAYDRHLRASRLRFRRRRDALLAALDRELPGYPVRGIHAGLHVLIRLPDGTDIPALQAAAGQRGMELSDPAELQFQPVPTAPWLPVGYANLNDAVVDEAMAVLADLLGEVTDRGRSAGRRLTRAGRCPT
jgi:GntR family transcriptional regulator / MocR family aminotransferase